MRWTDQVDQRGQLVEKLWRASRQGHAERLRERLADHWNSEEPVLLRWGLVYGRQQHRPTGPPLIRSHGLQLKLLLLKIFVAQAGAESGDVVDWADAVLAPTETFEERAGRARTRRGHRDLRHRQVREAARALEARGLLRRVAPETRGVLLSGLELMREDGRPAPYSRPERYAFEVDRRFFTNLWVFALTDAEIAVYLSLLLQRRRFPAQHARVGVFLADADRVDEEGFDMKDSTYRTHRLLTMFGLIERAIEGRRVRSDDDLPGVTWLPNHFRIQPATLDTLALSAVRNGLRVGTLSGWARDGVR